MFGFHYHKLYIDPDLVVPDKTKSLREGAIAPWIASSGEMYPWHEYAMNHILSIFHISGDTPWQNIPEQTRHAILYGEKKLNYEGIIPNMERRFLETTSDWVRDDITKYQNNVPCEACHGERSGESAKTAKYFGS